LASLKRCLLPLILIALASSVLLLSDWGQRTDASAGPSAPGHLTRKWKIAILQLTNLLDVEETEEGVMQGFKEAGLVEGRDYEVRKQNAQGDMATVNALVDNALMQRADLLITFSTPTLQAALQRASKVPIVFTYVANGVIAGAGQSATNHLPNVTGVDFTSAFDEMFVIMKKLMPSARRIGTIFVPAEVNSVFYKDKFEESARQAGLEPISVPASTSSEVPDAALALAGRGIDAMCQIPGNLTAAAFASIARAANRAKIPVFAFQTVQAHEGAAIVLARDYRDAGRLTGLMVARIMRGESPAKIPFAAVTRTRLVINPAAVSAAGLILTPEFLKSADELIR
jgi:ABC-type uncharacterized transport system substrate-binding protein